MIGARPVAAALLALVFTAGGAAATEGPGAPPTRIEPPPWTEGWDRDALLRAFAADGYDPGPDFKAVVIELERFEAGVRARWYDYGGTGLERDSWWPASSIKLPMAVAALETLKRWGFSAAAKVTFRYTRREVTQSVRRLVERALVPSDNHAYDRLGEIVGFDALNRRFLVPAKGFVTAVLQRGYSGRVKDDATGRGSLRHSAPLLVQEGRRQREVPERFSEREFDCPNHGNCFTLAELAETMRRVMLHEVLPRDQRFDLGASHLKVLRRALGTRKPRGNGVVDGLQAGFGAVELQVWHKPGYALQWFSDVVYLKAPDGREWIVAMANRPGREACDEPARRLGARLAKGPLSAPGAIESGGPTAVSDPPPPRPDEAP